jgi:hypothetical protein
MPTFIRTAPNLLNYQGFTFYPGANFVPDEQYESWKTKHKETFEKFFMLQLSGKPPAMTMEKSPVNAKNLIEVITKATEKEAIRIVEETLIIEVLDGALELEKRKAVVAALKKQVAEMRRTPEPEELKGGVKNYPEPPTGNMMDSLNIQHSFTEDKK